MFLQVSVCPQKAYMAGGCAWQGGMCGREGHAWQGGHAWQRGVHGGGHAWQGGVAGEHAWQGACMARGWVWWGDGRCAWQGACMAGVCMAHRPPPQQILRDTVNERAVRILLECILVFGSSKYVDDFGSTVSQAEFITILTVLNCFNREQKHQ